MRSLLVAGVQTVYAVQGVGWVYANRHVFNVDRDAERLVVTYLTEIEVLERQRSGDY